MENTTALGMLLRLLIILALLHLISGSHLPGFHLWRLNLLPDGGTEEAFSTLRLFPTSTTVVCDKDCGQSYIWQVERCETPQVIPVDGIFPSWASTRCGALSQLCL